MGIEEAHDNDNGSCIKESRAIVVGIGVRGRPLMTQTRDSMTSDNILGLVTGPSPLLDVAIE